jgi:hypothetical protein
VNVTSRTQFSVAVVISAFVMTGLLGSIVRVFFFDTTNQVGTDANFNVTVTDDR